MQSDLSAGLSQPVPVDVPGNREEISLYGCGADVVRIGKHPHKRLRSNIVRLCRITGKVKRKAVNVPRVGFVELLEVDHCGACRIRGRVETLMLAWPIGMLLVHPAVNVVRQLLGHRSFKARSAADYSKEPHGPVTRIFAVGPIGSTLGGAEFNRHLLHHWEPQISYTRFRELETFLLDSQAAEVIRNSPERQTSVAERIFS